MTESGAGADGRTPDRSRGGPPGDMVSLTIGRLALTLMVGGLAFLLLATGVFIGRSTQPSAANPTGPAAAADPQAGNLIGAAQQNVGGLGAGSASPARGGTGSTVSTVRGGTGAVDAPIVTAPPLAASEKKAAPAVAIHIPRLKVNQRMTRLSVLRDRSMSVPRKYSDIGWWSGGPRPGGPGATLIAGHVSSKSGPAVFFRLRDMRAGDMVTVDRADGTSAVFRVVGKASYLRSNFPDEVVYRVRGKPSIHLVTCDGVFDGEIGHHVDNLVVFADLVSTRPTHRRAPKATKSTKEVASPKAKKATQKASSRPKKPTQKASSKTRKATQQAPAKARKGRP